MTFAIAGRCERSGRLGVATATNPIGVGARMDPDYAEMAFGRRRKKPDGSIEPDFFLNKP